MCMDKVKDWLFGEEEEGYTEDYILHKTDRNKILIFLKTIRLKRQVRC